MQNLTLHLLSAQKVDAKTKQKFPKQRMSFCTITVHPYSNETPCKNLGQKPPSVHLCMCQSEKKTFHSPNPKLVFMQIVLNNNVLKLLVVILV